MAYSSEPTLPDNIIMQLAIPTKVYNTVFPFPFRFLNQPEKKKKRERKRKRTGMFPNGKKPLKKKDTQSILRNNRRKK